MNQEPIETDVMPDESMGSLTRADHISRPNKYSLISDERRSLIIHAIDQLGMSVTAASIQFGVPTSTISNIKKAFYASGQMTKTTNRGVPPKVLSDQEACTIRDWLDNNCLLSLKAIQGGCERQFNKKPSLSTLSRIIRAFHYTIKRTSPQPERRNTDETIQARALYCERYLSFMANRDNIYFVDESGFCVTMRRKLGRSLIGERAVVRVPATRSKNFSLCATFNINGMTHFGILERSFDSAKFADYMTDVINELRRANTGWSISAWVKSSPRLFDHSSNTIKLLVKCRG
jgi:transposase